MAVVDLFRFVVLEVAVAVNPSDSNTPWEDRALVHTLHHGIGRLDGNIAAIVVPVALSDEGLLVLSGIPALVVRGAVDYRGACLVARYKVWVGWALDLNARVYFGSGQCVKTLSRRLDALVNELTLVEEPPWSGQEGNRNYLSC
jgi:hypothetical protein